MRAERMQLIYQSDDSDERMSASIYAALIDSLFQMPTPVFAGSVLVAFAAALTAWKTGLTAIWFCVLILVASGGLRTIDMQWYRVRRSSPSQGEAERWEARYQFGAIIYAAALGIWCAVALLGSNDAVAHMICLVVTVGYIAGGVGRTFGRPWIYHLQIAVSCGITSIALALHGTIYYFGLAFVAAGFFFALRQITTNLQKIFVDALTAREREAALAHQFDTALNNMPHGLCMFRADGRLAVMNHRFSDMMGVPDDLVRQGGNAAAIVNACVLAGSISAADGKMILAEIANSQAHNVVTGGRDTARARSLSWPVPPM